MQILTEHYSESAYVRYLYSRDDTGKKKKLTVVLLRVVKENLVVI